MTDSRTPNEADDTPQSPTATGTPTARKIALECAKLERELSRSWLALEWLKALATPVALLGVLATLLVSVFQVHQAAITQEAARFEQTSVRLSSVNQQERLSAVAGLEAFLIGPDKQLADRASRYLVDSLGTEIDAVVQTSIYHAFKKLIELKPPPSRLEKLLRTAVENNRELYQHIRTALFLSNGEIPENSIRPLSRSLADDALGIKAAIQPFTGQLVAKEKLFALSHLGALIGDLVRYKVKLVEIGGDPKKGFSSLYCMNCDFSGATTLDGANFRESDLSAAKFTKASLENADFSDADLSLTNFFGASLKNAKMTGSGVVNSFVGLQISFPILECANLMGTDLTGRPIAMIQGYGSPQSSFRKLFWAPSITFTVIDQNTKIDLYFIEQWNVRGQDVMHDRIIEEIPELSDYVESAPASFTDNNGMFGIYTNLLDLDRRKVVIRSSFMTPGPRNANAVAYLATYSEVTPLHNSKTVQSQAQYLKDSQHVGKLDTNIDALSFANKMPGLCAMELPPKLDDLMVRLLLPD